MARDIVALYTHWPNGYIAGDLVFHKGKRAEVIAVPKSTVPKGEVPIRYTDGEEREKFATVPAVELIKQLTRMRPHKKQPPKL